MFWAGLEGPAEWRDLRPRLRGRANEGPVSGRSCVGKQSLVSREPSPFPPAPGVPSPHVPNETGSQSLLDDTVPKICVFRAPVGGSPGKCKMQTAGPRPRLPDWSSWALSRNSASVPGPVIPRVPAVTATALKVTLRFPSLFWGRYLD